MAIYMRRMEELKARSEKEQQENEVKRAIYYKDDNAGYDANKVRAYLTSYFTSAEDKKKISELILKQTPSSVYGFLDKYESNVDEAGGAHFFRQMITEKNFSEKESLIKHIAENLKKRISNSGIEIFDKAAEDISKILKKDKLTEQDADKLDSIVKGIRINDRNDSASRSFKA